MLKRLLYIPYFLLLAILFYSCIGPNKMAAKRKQIASKDSQLVEYKNTLENLSAQLSKKQERNEVDDTSTARIQKFIEKTNNEIIIIHKENSVLVGSTEVTKADWESLKKSLAFSTKITNALTKKVNLIADLIAHNTVVKIDQDVIFSPGKYTLDSSVERSINNFFEPSVRDIELFIKKYPDFPLSLVITAKGYADATTISESSTLYKELSERLKLQTGNPDAKQLNRELSNARAESVIKLFKQISIKHSDRNQKANPILYLYEGKGESLPNPSISDYKVDDPRRRVVLLFWSIFPD